MLTPGVRVIRGPDWSWGNQDGGEGHVGTVCEIGKSGSIGTPDKTVVVQWDNGNRTNYRVDYFGRFDLRVIDNAQIGVKHPNIVCDNCQSQGINGMKYKCLECFDYDLCYMCYHNDKHDLAHPFKRFDSTTALGVDLPIRQNGRKIELLGIFVGAKVVRGFNWEWGNQDGGDGKIGKVLDIRGWDTESSRAVAIVTWISTGTNNVYRLGHKGDCDIKYVEPASGGWCYPEHLPVLGHPVEQNPVRPATNVPVVTATQFSVGDKVKVVIVEEQLKAMQQGHGGWNPKMAEYIGQIGKVHRVTDKGDIRVQFEGCNNRWTFNPATLTKINSIAVGDIVRLRTDVEKVKELQKGHGEWTEDMKNSLGKLGKILKIYSDGDLRVQLDGYAWTLNSQCVLLVPGSATELANTMHASQNQRQKPAMMWQYPYDGNSQSGDAADQLVRAAAEGRLDTVQGLLAATPKNVVNMRSGGKTALQVAAHQGHTAIVRLLVQGGAIVNAIDTDGDTCLHYAAFGNQPEVFETLIEAGADLNPSNSSGCTPLHIAAHKQPARCVEILLAAGADPNRTDFYGDTALHDAIGKDNHSVIDVLIVTSGVDFTLRNKRGFNVLHHAALKGKNYAIRKLLYHARQLVDVKKDDGFSALHLAALNGHRDVVETLITVGQADVNLRNNRKQSALLLATSQGHCAVIELLINLRCDVCVQDEDGDSALHIVFIKRTHLSAVEVRQNDLPGIYEIIEKLPPSVQYPLAVAVACFLVQNGGDLDALNHKGQTPLSFISDNTIRTLIRNYQPQNHSQHNTTTNSTSIIRNGVENMRISTYNLHESPIRKNLLLEEQQKTRKSRKFVENNNSRKTGSMHSECFVCSDVSEENVRLEPCNHKPACEDCSARMKKCLQCGILVEKRITKDGRVVAVKGRQPSAERMRYLECKIAEIEESHSCSICMERKRNVVFLCGHGTCSKCADTLKTCHMCRKTITRKIPIY